MNFKERPLNQSLIHKFLYKGDEIEKICPKKIYHIDIIKSHQYRTESMLKGSFFETLCLGSGSGSKIVEDLPRKRLTKAKEMENLKRKSSGLPEIKGEKTVDQLRIEEQAKRFRILASKYQIVADAGNTQTGITVRWHKNPDIYLRGELDIFPTPIMTNDGLRLAIIDLKLTYDLNTTFGEFCWGSPEYMDLNQSYMYSYLVRQIANNADLNPHLRELIAKPTINLIAHDQIDFYYWVFSYKKAEDKLIKITWDELKENELHESIRKTINLIEYYEKMEWPAKPDYKLCKECTIFDCQERKSIQEL